MFNLRDRGVNFPVQPDENEWSESESSRVVFACKNDYVDIYPAPLSARNHVENNRSEFYYETTLSDSVKKYLTDSTVHDAMRSGWMLYTQNDIEFCLEEPTTNGEGIGMEKTGVITPVTPIYDAGLEEYQYMVTIHLKWVPIITDDDTLLLVTQPEFVSYDGVTVLSKVIDPQNIPLELSVTLLVREGEHVDLKYGSPVAKVIPLSKDVLRTDAEIVPPD